VLKFARIILNIERNIIFRICIREDKMVSKNSKNSIRNRIKNKRGGAKTPEEEAAEAAAAEAAAAAAPAAAVGEQPAAVGEQPAAVGGPAAVGEQPAAVGEQPAAADAATALTPAQTEQIASAMGMPAVKTAAKTLMEELSISTAADAAPEGGVTVTTEGAAPADAAVLGGRRRSRRRNGKKGTKKNGKKSGARKSKKVGRSRKNGSKRRKPSRAHKKH